MLKLPAVQQEVIVAVVVERVGLIRVIQLVNGAQPVIVEIETVGISPVRFVSPFEAGE